MLGGCGNLQILDSFGERNFRHSGKHNSGQTEIWPVGETFRGLREKMNNIGGENIVLANEEPPPK